MASSAVPKENCSAPGSPGSAMDATLAEAEEAKVAGSKPGASMARSALSLFKRSSANCSEDEDSSRVGTDGGGGVGEELLDEDLP